MKRSLNPDAAQILIKLFCMIGLHQHGKYLWENTWQKLGVPSTPPFLNILKIKQASFCAKDL